MFHDVPLHSEAKGKAATAKASPRWGELGPRMKIILHGESCWWKPFYFLGMNLGFCCEVLVVS